MYTPETYTAALGLMALSMICWGSWPNLLKTLPKWRLEYFYLDYTFGFILTILACAATLGSNGFVSAEFIERLLRAGGRELVFAALGGFFWNMGNVLLLTSIMIAGLAIAYPIGIILALVLGVGMSYWANPIGNVYWLTGGVLLLVVAAGTNAAAYQHQSSPSGTNKPRAISLALLAGVLIGLFPPFVGAAISSPKPLDPYLVSLCFVVGACLATLIAVPTLLAHPLIGNVGTLQGYWKGNGWWHLLGLIAGGIWCLGTVVNFVSAQMVGIAISWAIGSGAPMVGALWGIFYWGEFKGASSSAKQWIGFSLLLYVAGVVAVAVAYQLK